MNALFGWLAVLCLIWAAISFRSLGLSGVGRWVYAFRAVAFGAAVYLLPL